MTTTRKSTRRKKSETGYWLVDLARPVPIAGFTYHPGLEHRVDDATLAAMREHDAEAVRDAQAAE